MTRTVFAVFSAAALLGVAGAASAGPCEQLQGARWLHYIDGGRPTPRVGVGVWDFRTTVVNATIFAAAAPTPLPPTTSTLTYGTAEVQRVTLCRNEGNAALIIIGGGASIYVTLSEDGKSATTVGNQNLPGMTGWAVRQP